MQAKERLTGAIILVVLIVLIVPELLTGPRRSEERRVETSTDAAPMRSYTIELKDRGNAKPALPRAETPVASGQAPPGRAEPVPVEPAASAPSEPGVNRTEPAIAQRAEAGSAARVESPTPARREPARAAPEKTPAPSSVTSPAAAAPVTGWSIQVGSFASRDNAERLTGELKRAGYRSFVTEGTSGGRKLYRVRVGPEADRASAQALAERLKASGRAAAIVPYP